MPPPPVINSKSHKNFDGASSTRNPLLGTPVQRIEIDGTWKWTRSSIAKSICRATKLGRIKLHRQTQ